MKHYKWLTLNIVIIGIVGILLLSCNANNVKIKRLGSVIIDETANPIIPSYPNTLLLNDSILVIQSAINKISTYNIFTGKQLDALQPSTQLNHYLVEKFHLQKQYPKRKYLPITDTNEFTIPVFQLTSFQKLDSQLVIIGHLLTPYIGHFNSIKGKDIYGKILQRETILFNTDYQLNIDSNSFRIYKKPKKSTKAVSFKDIVPTTSNTMIAKSLFFAGLHNPTTPKSRFYELTLADNYFQISDSSSTMIPERLITKLQNGSPPPVINMLKDESGNVWAFSSINAIEYGTKAKYTIKADTSLFPMKGYINKKNNAVILLNYKSGLPPSTTDTLLVQFCKFKNKSIIPVHTETITGDIKQASTNGRILVLIKQDKNENLFFETYQVSL